MIRLSALAYKFGCVAFTLLVGNPLGSLALAADAASASSPHRSAELRLAHASSSPHQTTTSTIWTVTTTADESTSIPTCTAEMCTLRAAVYVAQPGDTIVFSSLFDTPHTIYVYPTVTIYAGVTITGPGTGLLTLSPTFGSSAILEVHSGTLGTVAISGLTFAGGFAGAGGAVRNSADLTLSDVIFRNNNATSQGGAIYNVGTLHVDRSTFTANTSHFGAALFNTTSTGLVGVATFTNSTIVGNTATIEGSAIASYGSINDVGTAAIHLQNCTVAGNKGATAPVLAAIDNMGPASLDLINTIISGNSGNSFDTSAGTANYASLGNNLSSDDGGGVLIASGDLINSDPLLSKLSNYGGTTPTLYPKHGSPAIDAGTGTGVPAIDQRGVTRPQGDAYDMGAVEADGELILQDGFEG